MASRTKAVRTFDAVQVRALPDGGYVISGRAPDYEPGRSAVDLVAVELISGVGQWLESHIDDYEGFVVDL